MLRITTLLLCLLLAAAAAGRYQAEVRVREARREIQDLGAAKAKALSDIQVLRAEIAYLESPERLAELAARRTDLRPLSGAQIMTAEEFLAAIGGAADGQKPPAAPSDDMILHALAMADLAPVR